MMRGRNKKFTEAELIEAMQILQKREGKCTVVGMSKHNDLPHARTIIRHFGSWEAAIKATKINTHKHAHQKYTKAELIEAMKILHEREGECIGADLKKYNDLPTCATFRKHFGSWEAAVKMAKFEPQYRTKPSPTESYLIQAIQILYEREGNYSIEILRRHKDLPSVTTFRKYFGTWNNAVMAAGLEPHTKSHKSKNH